MKLLFKQRLFSWFDSYDIYNEAGETVYVVKGELSWGHMLRIYDTQGLELGVVEEKILTLLPKFEISLTDGRSGTIKREFSLLPSYDIDFMGWKVDGDIWEWDYTIVDNYGRTVAAISKELLNLTDTYVLDISNPADALAVLAFTLAMDAEKCSRS